MPIDLEDPPSLPVYFRFWAEKWSHEYARNALLHYLTAKGLAEDCKQWLDKEVPPEEGE
jgi:hypothetical protein